MKDKIRTTLEFNRSNWENFKTLAMQKGTTVTSLLNEFVESYVNREVPEQYKEAIELKISTYLDKIVENNMIEAISDRVSFRLGIDRQEIASQIIDVSTNEADEKIVEQLKEISSTDSTDSIDTDTEAIFDKHTENIIYADSTDSTDSIDNIDSVDSVDAKEVKEAKSIINKKNDTEGTDSADDEDIINNADSTDSKNITTDTDDIDDTDSKKINSEQTKEEKRQINIDRFKHYKASENRKGYNDRYVANEENLATTTVSRYRRGLRSPKQDFVDKWGINWNGEQWIKNDFQK